MINKRDRMAAGVRRVGPLARLIQQLRAWRAARSQRCLCR